jgi:transposase
VKRTLSQWVRGVGLRRFQYIGLSEARLQNVATAAAINVYRLSDWLGGVPRAVTRSSPFVRLVA